MKRYKYFYECRTAEDGKKLYNKLAKQYHPDNGGDAEKMKEINAEFADWYTFYKDVHKAKDGTTYTSDKKTAQTASDYMDIVNKIWAVSDGIVIEVCGTWLWLSGNTYDFRHKLREIGCRWSKSKKQWYYTDEPYIKKKFTLTAQRRRELYGSEFLENENKRARIAG